jgi:hypothetical protein
VGLRDLKLKLIVRGSFNKLYQIHPKSLLILLATWGVYFLILFLRTLEWKPEGLYANHTNVWSDWSLHIGMANIFAYKAPQDWFAYHPMYADGKFTYGFLTNFISGLLMKAGFSLYCAFIVPSLIYTVFLLLGMYVLFYLLLKSQKQALLAISLFFLSSGLGSIKFIRDIFNHGSLGQLLFPDPGLDYSRQVQYQWYTGNFIVGMLLPQRGFLLGMAMAVWVLVGIVDVLRDENGSDRKHRLILLGSSVLAGLLPIAHMHSFIVIAIVTGLLCIISYQRWLDLLLYYVIPTSLLSLTLYLIFIAGGIENPNFMQWTPGWTAKGGLLAWIVMWIKIWGLMLPIAVFGFILLRKQPAVIQAFFLGFFGVFAFANLITLQPLAWDNSKLFLWAYFGFCGLAAVALAWGWKYGDRDQSLVENKRINVRQLISRLVVILVTILLTFTGFLELIRLQRIEPSNHPLMTSQEDINLGVAIREKTDPLARFLTAPIHNHPVMMWGARPILLGYPLWVLNYGFLAGQTQADLKTMFIGGAAAEPLLRKHRISYVAIGPAERCDWQANEAYYAKHYPVAFQNQNYRIYDVRSLW